MLLVKVNAVNKDVFRTQSSIYDGALQNSIDYFYKAPS